MWPNLPVSCGFGHIDSFTEKILNRNFIFCAVKNRVFVLIWYDLIKDLLLLWSYMKFVLIRNILLTSYFISFRLFFFFFFSGEWGLHIPCRRAVLLPSEVNAHLFGAIIQRIVWRSSSQHVQLFVRICCFSSIHY